MLAILPAAEEYIPSGRLLLWQEYRFYFRRAIHFSTLPNELRAARLILCYLFSRVPSLCCICRSAERLSDSLITEDVFYNYLVNTLAQISLHLVHLLSILPSVSLCQAYYRPTSQRSVKSHTSSILLELICYSKTFKNERPIAQSVLSPSSSSRI